MDAKLPLETVLEMAYLLHELKISNKTVIEWSTFFQECCIIRIIDDSTLFEGMV